MKSVLITIFLLIPLTVEAQLPPLIARYQDNKVLFDIEDGETVLEASGNYNYKIYINTRESFLTNIECTGIAKPWKCQALLPVLDIGNNAIYLTASHKEAPTIESARSNTLLILYAVNQKEIITEKQLVMKCAPSSFHVTRITDATKLQALINAIGKTVSHILGTSNAIYIFSCDVVP